MSLRRMLSVLLIVIFILADVALADNYFAKTTGSVTVYASAKTSSKKLGTLPGGTWVYLTAQKNGWSRIELNGKVGYASAASIKKTARAVYVKNASATIYKTTNINSTRMEIVGYGTKLNASYVKNGFIYVNSGSTKGYVPASSVQTKDPNTLNKTVYIKTASCRIYSYPTTSASSFTVPTSAALKCTAVYNGTWCRVTYNGKVGFVKKSEVSTSKSVSTASSPVSGKSVSVDWFKGNIQSVFAVGNIATVTDVYTGISWKVKRRGGTNHADVEPLTAADTAAMQRACGNDFKTWARRPIWVSIGGKKYAASMNCMNHGECNIKDNNFDGHHCIHFTNSKTHSTNKVDPDHQAAIKIALAKG